jgi:hypothetical protein
MHVSGDAMLRSHFEACHFQRVELRGDLKQCAGIFGGLVHLPHVPRHDAYLQSPGCPTGGLGSFTKRLKRHEFKLAGAVALAVDERPNLTTVDFELRLRFLVRPFAKTRQSLKPIHPPASPSSTLLLDAVHRQSRRLLETAE